MDNSFNPDNAVAVKSSSKGPTPVDTGTFNVDNAVPVNTTGAVKSHWDRFRQTNTNSQVLGTSTDQVDQNLSTMTKDVAKPQDSPNDGKISGNPNNAGPGLKDKPLNDGSKGSVPRGIKSHGTVKAPDYPPEDWLNATLHSAEGAAWSTFARPFTKDTRDMDEYLDQLQKKHPIASVVGGTAPFIVSAPFVPESLVPNIYLRTAAQFGIVGIGAGLNKAKDDPSKKFSDKVSDVAGETLKQMAFSPAFAGAQAFNILNRPYVSALARAGIVAGGSAAVSKVFGDNLSQAFKQGGMYGALSLIMETPHLAGTALGRGIINHTNSVYTDLRVKSGLPDVQIKVDDNYIPENTEAATLKKYHVREISDLLSVSDSPQLIKDDEGNYTRLGSGWPDFLSDKGYSRDQLNNVFNKFLNDEKFTDNQSALLDQVMKDSEPFTKGLSPLQKQVHTVTSALASQVPGIHEPQIISATIKLLDGTQIHGSSHDDALSKIGHTKDTMKEIPDVSFKEGFDKRGSTNFIYNAKGEKVGDINFKNMSEEGIDIAIEKQREGYGTSAIKKVFDSGEDTIYGDVGKNNTQAQKFWTGIGGKLNPTDSGNFKLVLSKEDFNKTVKGYTPGFTVQYPDGHTEFIDREQSKKEPFNLPTGHSEEVKGLNESKWMDHNDPEIINPDTLAMIANNEGKVDIGMIPGVPETAEMLQKSHEELKEKFVPYEVGQEGKHTAEVLRENLGLLARAQDKADAALRDARKLFDKADKDSSLDFIYRMEEGQRQKTTELQKIADTMRSLMDTKRDEVRALGTGKLENFIENYFPHVWDDPLKAGAIIKRIMGRRPFQGPASFLKKRTIPTTREGIELGFTPVTYNPIDSVMLKVREMERYLMAHRTIQALKEQGLIKFVRDGEKGPDGWVDINDKFGTVKYKNDAKETVLAGKYMIQKDAGRILNNYLSPGIKGKSYIYDLYRGAGNTLNQFQLGISAFHLGFTSMDATISKFALGINKLSTGDFAGAIKEFGKAPFAPVTNIMQGRELLQAWYGKDKGPLTNTIADLMATAGGRAKMDKFYATGMRDSMLKSIKEGKIATAAFKVPFYVVEQVARPIMEYIVPRQKMGVFMDMMKMELEKNPDMSHEQMRGVAQSAWNSVDNRMGQLVYDNLFWDRTTKDLAMASVRSLGWNLGTIREIGGGVKDVIGNVQDVIHGRAPKVTYRTAYVMALPIVTGLYGAIYQYLHTGQGPQELKDYFFPRNGAVDNKGQAARVSLPTYMKDIYHYTTNPVQTVINKFSPVNNTVMEMLANKDFYGVEIRNVDDPILQQIGDESKFMASQFLPFGFRNLGRDTRTSAGSKIEPFIGITPAPYDINMTAAEKEAYELEKGKIPVGSRTKEQAQHSTAKSKLRSDYMATKDRAPLDAAVDQGMISSKERKQLLKEAAMTPLQRMTQHLSAEEVEHIIKKATPDEKAELDKILDKKKSGREARGTWTDAEEELYVRTVKSQE